jgi:hypothetical protein
MVHALFTLASLAVALGASPDSAAVREIHDSIATPAGLTPAVWQMAQSAYRQARDQGVAQRQFLAVIDYSKPSGQKRLWVVNMHDGEVIAYAHVAHGKGSGMDTPFKFSNRMQSNASSIGVFVTGPSYWGDRGLSLRLNGLEPGINDRVLDRGVVLHGSRYVSPEIAATQGRVGRSLGCPAVSEEVALQLVPMLEGGAVLFAWYPEPTWIERTRWIPEALKAEGETLVAAMAPITHRFASLATVSHRSRWNSRPRLLARANIPSKRS